MGSLTCSGPVYGLFHELSFSIGSTMKVTRSEFISAQHVNKTQLSRDHYFLLIGSAKIRLRLWQYLGSWRADMPYSIGIFKTMEKIFVRKILCSYVF